MKWFLSGVLILTLMLGIALPAQAQSQTPSNNDGWVLLPQVFGGTVGTFGGLLVGGLTGIAIGATSCEGLPDSEEELESLHDLVKVVRCIYNVLTSTVAGMAIGMPAGAAIGVSLATPSDNFFQTYLGAFMGAFAGEAVGLAALYVVPTMFDMSWVDTIRNGEGFLGFTIMATIAGSIIGSYFN
jgi:integral membrane sensor domain MASE1